MTGRSLGTAWMTAWTAAVAVLCVAAAACGPDAVPGEAGGDASGVTSRAASEAASEAVSEAASEAVSQVDRRGILLDPSHTAWSDPAPDTFQATFETTRGDFVIEVVRAWAPVGADRFYNLIRLGYYDDVRFHRVVPGFITQWGVSGDPDVSAVWYDRGMPDDPVVAPNERGTIAFAFTEPGTRSTQVYISMVDNTRLDEQGFAPFGRVIEGMDEVVDSIYSGYGENSGGGVRRGDQSRLVQEGNSYLDEAFPRLDHLRRVTIPASGGPGR
jgi:cyclophilin family peptidyl-prolyl cis-trans isomerase